MHNGLTGLDPQFDGLHVRPERVVPAIGVTIECEFASVSGATYHSLGQMIAERAGHPLSVLILDEVFGSLDVDRRDAVIQLLHGLTGRFEQVILISHIEGIRDGLDHVVRCTFDERSGASRVEMEEARVVVGPELAGV